MFPAVINCLHRLSYPFLFFPKLVYKLLGGISADRNK